MDNFDEIRNLWQNHNPHSLDSLSGITDAIRIHHSAKRRKIAFAVLVGVICLAAMAWVIFDYQFNYWTTAVGESLFVCLSLYLLISRIVLLRKNKAEGALSANDYLDELRLRSERTSSTEPHRIIYLTLSVAFFLYVYEMLSVGIAHLIIGYTVLGVFLAFMWFVYRPRMIKKQRHKTRELLAKIKKIKDQAYEQDDAL